MTVPDALYALVDNFSRNADAYRSGRYNETQVRIDFINPFFELLGWDVSNRRGHPPAYQDVVHEDAIKVGGGHKAPDYGFRVGGTRRFFVEAKKPSVNLREDASPAFQLRRYAWSAKLPLSILTDFEEFAVYDCRITPDKDDKPSHARVLFHTFDQYADRWDEIAGIFSREAILAGSFDTYAEAASSKRGTSTVDAVFLKEIESWREDLARDLALHNPSLTRRELNFAVQMTIDRIIFLRITEDRGIEQYGRLQALLNGSHVYARLCDLYRQADERYNSGLFHFHPERDLEEHHDELTLRLTISDAPLKRIIKNLYFPESPYEFSVLPIEVLGQVYEQFLGKIIDISPDRKVTIEEKPEVRKAGGVYYTPKHIVDYIVEHTVGALLEGKKPGPHSAANNIRIVDPACGSGTFLIGAYEFLLDWHRDQYIADGPGKHRKELFQGLGGQWLLTTTEKKRILLNNIFGVDIDPQAVEVTKLSLLLKMLEGETSESLITQLTMFRERALPDLSNNIRCGNSLIGPDFYDSQQLSFLDREEHYRINVFDWNQAFPKVFSERNPGFDAVIGNPPYDVLEKERNAASWPHSSLALYARARDKYSDALGGKLNLFRFFLIRSFELLKDNARFGMIVPLAILADISCAQTRRAIMQASQDLQADCFPQKDNPNRRVFRSAKLSTTILTCVKSRQRSFDEAQIRTRIYPGNSFKDAFRGSTIRLADTQLLDPRSTPIPLADADAWNLCRKIHSTPKVTRLGDCSPIYCDTRRDQSDDIPKIHLKRCQRYAATQGGGGWTISSQHSPESRSARMVQGGRVSSPQFR
jgi:hypothetical protein